MAERNELTARELTVVTLVSVGRSNPEIASRLGVSQGTVKRHLSNVMLKWNATTRTEVAVQAVLRGLVGSSDRRAMQSEAGVCPLCGQAVAVEPSTERGPPEKCEVLCR